MNRRLVSVAAFSFALLFAPRLTPGDPERVLREEHAFVGYEAVGREEKPRFGSVLEIVPCRNPTQHDACFDQRFGWLTELLGDLT